MIKEIVILANGKMTKKTGEAFISIKQLEKCMMESEEMAKDMVKAFMSFAMVIGMKECGKKVINVVEEL